MQMDWLHYEVVDQVQEPRQVAGGVLFEPVWLVRGRLGSRTLHFWVNPETRTVVRRSTATPGGDELMVALGPAVPRIRLYPVQGLPGESPGGRPMMAEPLPGGP